ncbi:hypothetical protein [Chitinivibrio alkaliphilus]|uniref:DUF4249 family protein n=1 Tax=Chitinivibrio alkaliphilus ACht1 TaxID=1313304 RepID=U7D7R1_9BACT|nr:hypothetical protein [Chitinivibrio alkaliphilus]ERP31973.1 hypothetical protein CALK_1195 [Chitinivibrio alkaliphilus ACht1]
MKQYLNITLLGALILSLASCGTQEITGVRDNRAPILMRTVTNVAVQMNDSITISLRHVEAYDPDGDTMSVVLEEGEKYTLSGTTAIPDTDYIGNLFIPIRVFDGELYSDQDTLIVSVVGTIEIFPLVDGGWWQYRDSIPQSDTTMKSFLRTTYDRDTVVDDYETEIFQIEWENLEEEGLVYWGFTDGEGTKLMGGSSPTDTLMEPHRLYRYPVEIGETWDVNRLLYNASYGEFFHGETAQIEVLDTLVYVTVPAGTFECVKLVKRYTVSHTRSFSGIHRSPSRTHLRSRDTQGAGSFADASTVEETLYYAPGVGYIQNITRANGAIVWIKELVDYEVEEGR